MKFIAFLIILFLSLPALAKSNLRIAMGGNYPPFHYRSQDGALIGFNVDFAEELCRHINSQCEMVIYPFDSIVSGLQAGKYDLIISSMSITKERKEHVLFSIPYYSSSARFVVPKIRIKEFLLEGLKKKKIGVQRATTHATFLRNKYPGVFKVVEYDSYETVYLDLYAKRIDAFLDDTITTKSLFLKRDKAQDYQFFGPYLNEAKWFGQGIGIALKKNNFKLKKTIDKAIVDMRKDGTYQKINRHYFSFDIYQNE